MATKFVRKGSRSIIRDDDKTSFEELLDLLEANGWKAKKVWADEHGFYNARMVKVRKRSAE